MKLSNGLNSNQYLTSISVSIQNEDGETVASGYTDKIDKNYYIEPMGYSTFTFYISPKYVSIHDDDLNSLTYQITTKGRVEDPSVLSSVASDGTDTSADAASTAAY